MDDILAAPDPDPRKVLGWLPPYGEWRELWFTHRPGMDPVPDEPILADLEAAVLAGWAEGGEMTFGFNDDNQADGARTMRAYCTTPAGLRAKAAAERRWASSPARASDDFGRQA
ncbi:hypothetical protein [Roseomonas populi]|uniref:Uncharacterized protein n=1 Tax=Roseomonas populi TaxID=3121582 RepID=A0ABT1WZY0_9PROT|nr:hypothetical protein [Roseomonas pecuniae]MCR0981400.1 hypothetical protein [Roseomonas pecuniae]